MYFRTKKEQAVELSRSSPSPTTMTHPQPSSRVSDSDYASRSDETSSEGTTHTQRSRLNEEHESKSEGKTNKRKSIVVEKQSCRGKAKKLKQVKNNQVHCGKSKDSKKAHKIKLWSRRSLSNPLANESGRGSSRVITQHTPNEVAKASSAKKRKRDQKPYWAGKRIKTWSFEQSSRLTIDNEALPINCVKSRTQRANEMQVLRRSTRRSQSTGAKSDCMVPIQANDNTIGGNDSDYSSASETSAQGDRTLAIGLRQRPRQMTITSGVPYTSKKKRNSEESKDDVNMTEGKADPTLPVSNNDSDTNGENFQTATQSVKSPARNQLYEVESILDYRLDEKGEGEWCIKWLGYGDEHITWEKKSNLVGCKQLLRSFFLKRVQKIKKEIKQKELTELSDKLRSSCPPDPRGLEDKVKSFFKAIGFKTSKKDDKDKLKQVFKQINSERRAVLWRWPISKFNMYFLEFQLGLLSEQKLQDLREYMLRLGAIIESKRVRLSLENWEKDLNVATDKRPELTVENKVDLEGPPDFFKYVNGYVPGRRAIIPEDSHEGCNCEGSCNSENENCCSNKNKDGVAYDANKRLLDREGYPIYECNQNCKCDSTCQNRVVQDGTVSLDGHSLCIFRTELKGWGVKTKKPIKKGQFVGVYAGELISTSKADRRGIEYDNFNCTYLFDLDSNVAKTAKWVVDAKNMGNFSHFFNHSCDPNLQVHSVFAECRNQDIPMLSFFATRDICAGEELTFHYTNSKPNSKPKKKKKKGYMGKRRKSKPNDKKYKCFCGARNCIKYFLVIPDSKKKNQTKKRNGKRK